jgi:hypothetical protein
MDNKSRYREFCKSGQVPIYYQPWYLDAVSSDGFWDVALYEEDDQILGVWPYYVKRKYSLSYITLPPLTAYLGPWYDTNLTMSTISRLKFEKKVLTILADQIPAVTHLLVTMPPAIHNWKALYWKGFHCQMRYTFILPPTSTNDAFKKLDYKQRNNITQAAKSFTISKSDDIAKMYDLIQASFDAQHIATPYNYSLFKQLDVALSTHNSRTIYFAADQKGQAQSGIYIAHDRDTSYCLATGKLDDAHRGAVSLLLWESIKDSMTEGRSFDFEGSMIEGIDRFFRSFGGEQVPYFKLLKFKNRYVAAVMQWLARV